LIPIIIINLDDSIERWESLSKQLSHIGLNPIRLAGTLGCALSEQDKSIWANHKKNRKQHHRNLTDGEIGCYISHYRAWEKIVEDNISACILLEDDLNVDPGFTSAIETIETLPKSWDLIKLYDGRPTPFYHSTPIDNEFSVGNYKTVPNGCQAYAVSLTGAKKLLARKPFFRPVDIDIQFHSEIQLNVIGIKPYKIKVNREFESDIERVNKGRHSNHSSLMRNLKYRINMFIERQKVSGKLPE